MTVLPLGGDVYSVTTESGAEYRVDARTGRCDCPDAKHNLPTDDELASGDDGRPDDCDCGDWNDDTDLPCWPCYRDGFDAPNPDAPGDDE